MYRNTCFLCNIFPLYHFFSCFFLSCNPEWPNMFLAFFFAKKRTVSASRKGKIVTIYKIFDAVCVFFIIFFAWCQWKLNFGYINSLVIVLTHWKLLFHFFQANYLLKLWNCCKSNYFNTHSTTVSFVSIF